MTDAPATPTPDETGAHDDAELLRRYARDAAEDAFAALVRRHVNLVHSAALRQVNGDAHLAADVTQMVFVDLARKAAALARHRVLAGWLFTSTRYAAAKAVRSERRRAAREQEAQLMQEMTRDSEAPLDWARVRPVLDEALGELNDRDREAILLRYFENRDYASVGARLRISANTARMRVERALEKLRVVLARRGLASTTAALAASLGTQAVMAAPAGLAGTVTGAALSGASVAGGWATFMSITKLQLGLASALAVAMTAGWVSQSRSNAALRAELDRLRADHATAAAARTENVRLGRVSAEVADMRNDDAELKRLQDEAATLQAKTTHLARLERARTEAEEVVDLAKLDQAPRARSQSRPQYPAVLRAQGITGTVVVSFIVDAKGELRDVRADKTTLDEKSPPVVKLEPFTVAADRRAADATAPTITSEEATKLLEASAVDAVSQWKFSAGRKGGRDVHTRMQIPITFALNKSQP
jgi:RNA polymerase sigma factor (sigma-70 family)